MPDTQDRARRRHQVEILPLEPVLITVEDAGRLCGLEKSEAYELVARGIIPSIRFSERCIRVPVDALRERMNQLALSRAEEGRTA